MINLCIYLESLVSFSEGFFVKMALMLEFYFVLLLSKP